jgi:serine phosphatase RsbU (regulator of sigma subunit)/AcrR family transcriptional regulator
MSAPQRRARRSDASRNRAAILEAGARALRSTDELQLRRVAEAAGVSRSTLHRHFASRAVLEEELRAAALAELRRTIAEALAGKRPPLAMLRRLVLGLVRVAAERRVDRLGGLDAPESRDEFAAALVPALERLRRAAEIVRAPPAGWQRRACAHFLEACLDLGARPDAAAAAEDLFHSLTDPLDRGLVVLDERGGLVCLNPRAAELVAPAGRVEVGERLSEPRAELLYEDGSPAPGEAYPLRDALRSEEPRVAVLGHRGRDGEVHWVAVAAHPLRSRADGLYGVLGVLRDVTVERAWELERLPPPGRLGTARAVPLDIARVLDEIPPHLFPEQFVAEARRVSGNPVALYVLDIDGTHLLRLAGPEEFPGRLDAPLALGPELAEDGVPDLRARLEAELPGAAIAPMWLRGRAIGLLLGLRAREEALLELARHGAAAMELAGGYTDVIEAARRRKETQAAAELQQSMLPARIARLGGGELAGSVLPSYEVGGDWFDYVENRDGAWIAVGDAAGKGPTAGALGGIALAALRAARRSDQTLEEAARSMHEVIYDVGRPEFFVTAIVARWSAVYSTFSWINCGHPPPLVVGADGRVEQLPPGPGLPLGLLERDRRFTRRQRRLGDGERLILHSDGITARKTPDGLFGVDGIERAVRAAPSGSAWAIARAIQEAVMSATTDPLQDDAVAIVLAPERAAELAPPR